MLFWRETMIDLLRTRRSIRKYKKGVIDPQALEIIKEALLRCPSSRGINHRTFFFVDDRGLLSALSKVREQGSNFIKDAALGIIICGDETKSDVWVEDCAIASIVAQLTTHSLGLGSCWIQIRNRVHSGEITAEEYIQALLNIPRNLKVLSVISIGVPAEAKSSKLAEELDYAAIRYTN
jgi:nitroreductase